MKLAGLKAPSQKPHRNGTMLFGDLFSGAGGISSGFARHGAFKPVFAVDRQSGKPCNGVGTLECNSTYQRNIGLAPLERDLTKYTPADLMKETGIGRGELDVLISCAPCTGFSRTLRKNHLEDDPRNHLVERTGDFVEALQPTVLVMENARELIQGNFAYHSENLRQHLLRLGYSFLGEVHMLSRFGLPQLRERALIIACRDGGLIRTLDDLWDGYEVAKAASTVRRAIGHLPPIAAGEIDPVDPMHTSPRFGPENTARLKAIPKDGGSWMDLIHHADADRLLIPSMKRCVERGDFGSHPDVYGRLAWDRPGVTIKRECAHAGNGRYCHPEQDRMLTVREMALLQGFPFDYVFVSKSLANAYRHIGDAVPPLIAFQLAHLCHWMLTGEKPRLADCILPGTSLKAEDIKPSSIPASLFA